MMREQFRREKEHGAGIAIAGHLLGNGLISPGEYREVEAALMKK